MLSRDSPHCDVVRKYSVDAQMMTPDYGHSTTSLLIRAQQVLGAGFLSRVNVARSRNDDAVNVLNHQCGDLLELLLRISSRVGDLHHEVLRQSRPYDAASDLGEKWIVDLVDTGNTLRANGLVERETILECGAVLVANRASQKLKLEAYLGLMERLEQGETGKGKGEGGTAKGEGVAG